jgi:hypothetical protein
LTPLFALEAARRRALDEAGRAAAAGDGARTLEHALAANRLRADAESARLLAIGYLLTRDFARALQYQQLAHAN